MQRSERVKEERNFRTHRLKSHPHQEMSFRIRLVNACACDDDRDKA
jgi:hypothetical protein